MCEIGNHRNENRVGAIAVSKICLLHASCAYVKVSVTDVSYRLCLCMVMNVEVLYGKAIWYRFCVNIVQISQMYIPDVHTCTYRVNCNILIVRNNLVT